ncbi:Protein DETOXIFICATION [Quillaja saponaria]|uniref:Protein DETOXIFICATION n=1 Tax=Quillaja saponaria TaxID=32244 RepID=A0AAD7M815_QUISA|nr:Protein DETOXIFICATION [Quillaja saponaria]
MGIWRRDIVEEIKKQLWLSGPMISVSLCQYGLQVISVMFVGHLDELSLSGASLASSLASVTGYILLMGLSSALETLCGQSYGAQQYHMLGIHMQRAMFALLIVIIPIAIIWANMRLVLLALQQDPKISKVAGTYARLLIPSLPAYGLFQCLVKFLQSQNIVFPMVLTTAFTAGLHVLLCWTLVLKSGLGSKGAAVANCISYWINAILLTLYVRFSSSCTKTWTGFSKEAFHKIPKFLRLAVPSALMVCLESWTFELMVLLSGLLPNPKLQTSVLSICLNTSLIFWMIPFGLAAAASVRISNELGAGHPNAARLAVKITLSMTTIEGVLVFILLFLIRNIWGHAFSNAKEVVNYVASLMPILATLAFLDAIQTTFSGIARGCGWQKLGAFVNLGSYYLIGVPLSVVFAFVLHMNGKGLWLGIVCALAVQVLCLFLITLRSNWEKEANKATERVNGTGTIVPVDMSPERVSVQQN